MNNIQLRQNFILETDSYKHTHLPEIYPEGTEALHSYLSARIRNEHVVQFGPSMWVKKKLLAPITKFDIDEAEDFMMRQTGCFDRGMWDHILNTYGGHIPLTIRGLPEGTVTDSYDTLLTIQCDDKRVFPLAQFIEASLQSDAWYGTTIATNDLENYLVSKSHYDLFSDNPGMLPFSLHDFGARGVTCEEQRQIGGAAHLIFFQGSDTISGIRAANLFYDHDMAGYSVRATEHSIQCAYGPDRQEEYIRRVLEVHAKPGNIVSLVLDGYNVWREAEMLCTKFHDQIVASGAKIVFRPDSGDMFEVVPRILEMQEKYFGAVKNSKNKKVINHVGAIQGDGMDRTTFMLMNQKIVSIGYAPESCIYGSGGGLLQKVNRDTLKVAQKASAIKINGVWQNMFKDPITDPGKKSKTGIQNDPRFVTFYKCDQTGIEYRDENLDEVRERAFAGAAKLLHRTSF
jgi:nicotinamide phosphoribosyltransferase